MTHRLTTVLFAVLLMTGYSLSAAVSPVFNPAPAATKMGDIPGFETSDYSALGDLTVEEFLELRPKEIAKITGERMTVKDRVFFSLAKENMRKQLKKAEKNADYEFTAPQDSGGGFHWNWGAFVLGLLLGLIGLIISFFFKDKKAWISALIGMAIWAVVFFLIL